MNNLQIITLRKLGITDFAKERNILLKNSKANWILFVDSDETPSRLLRDEINNLQFTIHNKFSGYKITRKNYFLKQYVGEDKIIRLGNKNTGRWQRAVHETWNIKGKVGELKNPLIHNTANYLRDYISKLNKYSDIHAKENYKEGKKSNLFIIIFYPIGKFLATLIKSGNVVFSIMQSFHSFLSWSKEWTLQNA